ncbi:MAG TPA: HAMP domain-containing sensor histidine kinase [Egibacteraceae bacterium]|nr:HAMP domain-containing sensor histidine kinase [Egibacteraceae bacterium]
MDATTRHPVSPAATPSPAATGAAVPSERRPRFGLRGRLVASFALLLLVALAASLVAARAVLLSRLDNRIDADLDQEVEELRQLASGTDPQTGLPLRDDVRRLFSLYLERNVPVRNEALVTYVDGRPYLRSRPVMPYRLDQDEDLTGRWADLEQSERGAVSTPAGPVKYVAVPVRVGDNTAGVYVAARFKALEEAEVDEALRALAFVGVVALVVASALAAWIATRILRRVSEATEVAHRISETDLSQRLPADGSDELAVLATTLNGMLGRLQEAFESQRRFIDDVGHELRTPLTIVQGHLEQLEDDPQEREETLRLVMDELHRMGRLVGELLVLARAERPDFLDLDLVDLAEVTEELCGKAPALGRRRWEVDGLAQGRIVADRQRVTQAVMQLAENAVRQTGPDDAIAIGSALAGDVARIWVRDTGPGIPPEEQPHLFERFRTGGRSKGGSGLGLSIVRAIAEAHGGRVEVRSRVGAGATFTLALPTEGPTEGAA